MAFRPAPNPMQGSADPSSSSSDPSGSVIRADNAQTGASGSTKRPHRTYARRSCLSCRQKKTRCELPDIYVESSKDKPVPAAKRCHRCSVLQIECFVWDGDRKRVRKLPSKNDAKRGSVQEDAGPEDDEVASIASDGAVEEGQKDSREGEAIQNLMWLPEPIAPAAEGKQGGNGHATNGAAALAPGPSDSASEKEQRGAAQGTSASTVSVAKRRRRKPHEQVVINSSFHPYLLFSEVLNSYPGFGRDMGSGLARPADRRVRIPLDPADIVDEGLSQQLEEHLMGHRLMYPHIPTLSFVRAAHLDDPVQATALLLAVLYILALRASDSPSAPRSDPEATKQRLCALEASVHAHGIAVLLSRPFCRHAVLALELISQYMPFVLLPASSMSPGACAPEGGIGLATLGATARRIAECIELDKAPQRLHMMCRRIYQRRETPNPRLLAPLLWDACQWYSLIAAENERDIGHDPWSPTATSEVDDAMMVLLGGDPDLGTPILATMPFNVPDTVQVHADGLSRQACASNDAEEIAAAAETFILKFPFIPPLLGRYSLALRYKWMLIRRDRCRIIMKPKQSQQYHYSSLEEHEKETEIAKDEAALAKARLLTWLPDNLNTNETHNTLAFMIEMLNFYVGVHDSNLHNLSMWFAIFAAKAELEAEDPFIGKDRSSQAKSCDEATGGEKESPDGATSTSTTPSSDALAARRLSNRPVSQKKGEDIMSLIIAGICSQGPIGELLHRFGFTKIDRFEEALGSFVQLASSTCRSARAMPPVFLVANVVFVCKSYTEDAAARLKGWGGMHKRATTHFVLFSEVARRLESVWAVNCGQANTAREANLGAAGAHLVRGLVGIMETWKRIAERRGAPPTGEYNPRWSTQAGVFSRPGEAATSTDNSPSVTTRSDLFEPGATPESLLALSSRPTTATLSAPSSTAPSYPSRGDLLEGQSTALQNWAAPVLSRPESQGELLQPIQAVAAADTWAGASSGLYTAPERGASPPSSSLGVGHHTKHGTGGPAGIELRPGDLSFADLFPEYASAATTPFPISRAEETSGLSHATQNPQAWNVSTNFAASDSASGDAFWPASANTAGAHLASQQNSGNDALDAILQSLEGPSDAFVPFVPLEGWLDLADLDTSPFGSGSNSSRPSAEETTAQPHQSQSGADGWASLMASLR
ncbi:hypothetical protein IE81DRAFT_346107 [Ceraceosorus guamensis]|uniref:Zn(2)-C6 fungal-type domain-containing protein n=1 Tax=Ceraceosorus guamensis TaxID=1522189 RepID=A0A316W361_9BASI|nr:hypothetical protein IE81DRAFT_346107 [Ceraceosorus guamensis]PWN43944.1 hypothetical protein IE81DRAFT_346107 [Ceraceosorus guamensis]